MQNGQHSNSQHSKSTPLNCRRGAEILQQEKAEALALWSIAVAQLHGPRPGFHRLLLKEFGQQIQVFLLVISLQGTVVGTAVFLVDDHGRIVVDHQPVVQQRPSNTPVAPSSIMRLWLGRTGSAIWPARRWTLTTRNRRGRIIQSFAWQQDFRIGWCCAPVRAA